MKSPNGPYMYGVLKGLQSVIIEAIKLQETECKQCLSPARTTLSSACSSINKNLRDFASNKDNVEVDKTVTEVIQRSSMVFEGMYAVLKYTLGELKADKGYDISIPKEFQFDYNISELKNEKQHSVIEHISISSEIVDDNMEHNFSEVSQNLDVKSDSIKKRTNFENENTVTVGTEKTDCQTASKHGIINNSELGGTRNAHFTAIDNKSVTPPKAKKPPKKVPALNENSKQSTVPSSRIARVFSFGTLAAGLGVGTVAELTRRTLGMSDMPSVGNTLDSAFITPANAERIVNTLCKVRGAALKIGQILSIQDNSVISPQFQKMFERVRQSADFMPVWQVEKVLSSELGSNWKSKFSSIDLKPFAAASIGQVHAGVLNDGREVAIKIQYPGVAKGIESDVDNLMSVLKMWNIFPQGLFIDNLIEVAKRELAWEVDYVREAECTRKFKELLKPYKEYVVPTVIDELSTSQIFTTELMEGVPVDKCAGMDIEVRNRISMLTMQLILREIMEFRYMQTDPNWSNFIYNTDTKQLILLDFGASREYSKQFIDQYVKVMKSAVDGDRKKVLEYSRKMGFLTGYESKIMEEAHVEAVMILGELFCEDGFDFGAQSTTERIQSLVPTIINHRLCPPPEEIYSLHRKLSGESS